MGERGGRVLAVQGAPCVGYGERGALGTASPVRAVDGGAVGSLPLRRPRQLDVSRMGSLEPGMGGRKRNLNLPGL